MTGPLPQVHQQAPGLLHGPCPIWVRCGAGGICSRLSTRRILPLLPLKPDRYPDDLRDLVATAVRIAGHTPTSTYGTA